MKLRANNYVIDIKVKNDSFSDRNNLFDTIGFLNMASIAFQKAADSYKADGKEFIASDLRRSVMISMQHLKLLEHTKIFN